MSLHVTLTLPDSLKKPIDELEKHLDVIDPPKTKGAPRKISNRELAVKLVYMAFSGNSWRSFGPENDAARKRFNKLSKDKAFESFFLQLYPKAKMLWEN
jgi:hypothetical protein